ncbi:MAG: hypothetical protein K6F00_03045 [Lachnospiraceae bacterium]|nr:hypothetical protein [Lachnospiraceae bacterium]
MTFRYKQIALAMVVSSSLLFTGCGPFPEMVDLSDKDVENIAVYCSHAVSKFNINQDKGLVFVPHDQRELKSEEPLAEEEPSAEESQTDEGTEEPDDVAPPVPEDEELPTKEEEGDTEGDTEGTETGAGDTDIDAPVVTDQEITLTEAIGIKGVSFIYKGTKVSTDYRSGDVYDLTPDDGYELLVMRIKARNNTSRDISMDLTEMGLRFKVDYEGQQTTSKATLLLNDLTTFDGTIKANKTKNLIILFQFPIGTVKDVQKIKLSLPRADAVYSINLTNSSK